MEEELISIEEKVYDTMEQAKKEDKEDFDSVKASILYLVMSLELRKSISVAEFKRTKREVHRMLSDYYMRSQSRFEDVLFIIGDNTYGELLKLFTEPFEAFEGYLDKWHANNNSWSDNLKYALALFEMKIMSSLSANIDYTAKSKETPTVDTKKVSTVVQKAGNTYSNTVSAIMQDEGHYVMFSTLYLAAKANGYKYFRFKAVLDNRTSDICRSMNGRVFPMSAWSVGSTVPPLHRHCRSTVHLMRTKQG